MNILQSALAEAIWDIPEEILQLAFLKNTRSWRSAPLNLNEEILTKVIKPRVMKRMAERGGQTVKVPLAGLEPMYVDREYSVYRIPPQLLNNREIVCINRVSYLPLGANFAGSGTSIGTIYQQNMWTITSIGSRIADAASMAPLISTAQVELVGHNTISVKDQIKNIGMYTVFCQVTDDPYLNNIHPRSLVIVAAIFEQAIKAYIYKYLNVKIDMGVLDMGQEVGVIRNIVDGYADAESMFKELMKTKWGKIALINDGNAWNRELRSMINPGL